MTRKEVFDAIFAGNIEITAAGCWEWICYRLPNGSGRTRYLGRNTLTHRLAWTLRRGPIPAGLHIRHKCENPSCCNPRHLALRAAKQNHDDARAKDRLGAGISASSPHRRRRLLTDRQVEEIRTTVTPCAELARRFGCTYTNVYMIRRGLRKIATILPTPVGQ